jgi:fibronectin type 3 domain-containing protein
MNRIRTAALGLTGAAALSATAAADLAGFVAFTRNVGSNTVIDVFVGVTNASDKFLNVYATNSNGTFVQKAGLATKTWKPDMAGFGSTRATADDSFMTAGTFSGGSYGGEYYASANTNGDPSFTGTSWNGTPASAAATTIPYVDMGNPDNDGAGWYSGDPPSEDNGAEPLADIPGTRSNSTRISGGGAASAASATHGIWVAHLVLSGNNRTLGEGGTATWAASASVTSGGSTVQARHRFVLEVAPSAPTSVAASDGTSTAGVTVTWSAPSGATGYKVFRADGSASPSTQIGTSAGASYSDTTAVAGTLYNYAVKATNSSGDSPLSTANAGWRNVPAPTGVSASDATSTSGVTVTWNAVGGATGYKVFRAQGSGSATQVGTTLAAVRTFVDTTAAAATVYKYSVRATTAAGDSAASATDDGSRAGTVPTGVSATDGTSTASVTVTWNAVVGATGYKVFRAQGSGSSSQVGTTAASVRTFADSTAVGGVLYSYSVKATTADGDGTASAADPGWRNVPAPAAVGASDGTSATGITVTWGAVTGATGYKVYRSQGSAAASLVGTTSATTRTLTDSTAAIGVAYSYAVKAATAAGDSASSASDTGWRNVAAPTGVSATDGSSSTEVTVTWNAVSSATGYRVFRSLGSGAPAQVGTTSATVRTFADTTAVPGTVYAYTVKARSALGDGAASAPDNGSRGVSPPTGVSASDGTSTATVTVTWNAYAGATGYKVYRSQGSATPAQVGTTTASVRTFTDPFVDAGVPYSYTVRATTASGDSATSAPDTGWRGVAPPVGVVASDGEFTTHVRVTWSPSTNAAVTGYRILRKIGTAAETTVGSVAGRTTAAFNDTGIPVGSVGTYRVAALTAAGASTPSASNTGFKKNSTSMPTGDQGAPPSDGGEQAQASSGSGLARRGTVAGLSPNPGGPAQAAASSATAGGAGSPSTGWPGGLPLAAASCELVTARIDLMRPLAEPAERPVLDALLAAPAPGANSGEPDQGCVACRLLAGDVDLDGTSGAPDAIAWLDAWSRGDWATADIDRDGWMDDRDLGLVLRALHGP